MSADATTEFGNELPVGYRLEEFEIKSVLGSGGFGITYLAYDIDLKRDVVVKENLPFQCAVRDSTRSVRPRTSATNDKDAFAWALNSFMREAETLSHFDHPNIVRVLRRFEANNTAYFVMPYLPGKSLKQVIEEQVAEGKAFTEPKLKELIMPLLDALEALHAEGVYHRDIKAANILLGKGHKPILIDFGAARQFISEKSHTIVESAGFTPFEQLQSHGNVGPWSDIYALAATFYTAIHGEPPPRASDRIRRDPAVKLADNYSDTYSRPFLEALDWALRVDETERPQSVAQWRAALDGSAPAPKAATPPALPQKTAQPSPPEVEEPEEVYIPALDPMEAATVAKLKKQQSKPALPKPVVPPKPSEPFPWGFVLKIVGAVGGALIVLAVLFHFCWPLLAKPGSLKVASVPSGAKVQIKGQPDATTPASYPSLRIGKYQVVVSMANYDPVTLNVEIKEGAAYPLDPVQLVRTAGTLSLTTVPWRATYHIVDPNDSKAKDYEGTAPVTLENIPAGAYKLTLTASNLGTHTESINVAGHQTTKLVGDLVKLSIADDVSTPAEKALLGQIPAAQLTGSDKDDYVGLVKKALSSYLHYNMFPQAEDQVTALKQLGQDTQDQDKKIAAMRDSYEKSTDEKVQGLVSDGKISSAASEIKAYGDAMGSDAETQLSAKYQSAIAAYQQQSADAIKQAQSGDPSAGYDQLNAFAQKHPDDVNVELALGNLIRKMPPDHDKLGALVTSYKNFNTQYLGADESGQFQDMQGHLASEYSTYNDLQAKLNTAKNGPAALAKHIQDLQDEIASNQRKLAQGDGVSQAVNSITSIFGAHVGINTSAVRASIAKEQDELNEAQAEQQNPTADVTTAQDNFNAFTAKVPW